MAQVKIGDNPNVIDPGSVLELESRSRALVLTRITTIEMEAIVPLQGAIVYNTTEQCVYYYNGGQWNNLCNGATGLSFVDNSDGTFTIDVGNGPISFNGALETITSLVDNLDGTYTYTNESGDETLISGGSTGGVSITNNGDDTYTVDDGVNPSYTFNGAPETITNLVDNLDGTYTYTNEAGVETIITTSGGGGHTGTAGSVFFANGTTGAPAEDNGQLFWDDVNKRLGIGMNVPTSELQVEGLIKTRRVQAGGGNIGFPGFHFTNNSNSGMLGIVPGEVGLVASGQELIRLSSDQRVGILVTNPLATLHVGGDLRVDGVITTGNGTMINKSAPSQNEIRRVSESKVALVDTDHTIILEATVTQLNLPGANDANKGHIYIIKDLGGTVTNLNIPYRDQFNKQVFTIANAAVLWLQSDGKEWQQIN